MSSTSRGRLKTRTETFCAGPTFTAALTFDASLSAWRTPLWAIKSGATTANSQAEEEEVVEEYEAVEEHEEAKTVESRSRD